MIVVLSFLFKGESFSFVRGLWLLDLNNRNTFFVDIFWIYFASDVLKWWLYSLLLPSIVEIHVRSIFSAIIVLSTGGHFGWSVFCRGTSTRSAFFILDQGVFISFIVIYDYFVYFLVAFGFSILYWKIWYCWCFLMQGRGRIGGLELTSIIEITWIFQNWSG